MRRLLAAAAAMLCLTVSTHTFAQTSNATLGGTVGDATGALIPGVTITAANIQTGIVSTVVSNEAGAYQFASLQTGTYRLSAELPGFRTQTYSDVVLGVSQQVRLNFTLQVGSQAQSVDVTVAADTLIATTSSSVGMVLPEYKVRDLPLSNRDVLGLIATMAGTQTGNNNLGVFAGNRVTAVNTMRDGLNVSDGRYDNGAFSVTYTSPDLVEEVRVIVAPADAEAGRGSGQVQMTTRSGTNQYRGSVFWTNRNSALDANTWFNNFNGNAKNYLNRNQYGGRLGGPVIRNKTFFFFLFEGQRIVAREFVVGPVLTAQARQGMFRYFPGVQSGNAISSNPTVDLQGNPVSPRGATGSLSSFNVFTRDPLRTGFDRSGYIPMVLSRMPLPNDFTTGDGLNTAGIRWERRISGADFADADGQEVNRKQYNFRVDHNFNSNHKLFVVGTKEKATATVYPPNWPNGFNGLIERNPDVYSASFVSTLSSTLVNEFRVGRRRSSQYYWAATNLGDKNPTTGKPTKEGEEAFKLVPTSNGAPFLPKTQLFPEHFFVTSGSTSRGTVSPLTMYADTISWIRGQHAFKGGFEARFTATKGGTNGDTWPKANLGAGGVPVTGIDGAGVPGLTGNDQTLARQILTDLNGSVASVQSHWLLNSSKDPVFRTYPDQTLRYLDLRQNEWGAFFKDDWKIRANLTLNLGVRYDKYGVPYEIKGILARPVGGSSGVFGISGAGFADAWQPGRLNGRLTAVEFIGKHSPNGNTPIYKDDWNNFAPAVGLSWSIPWWGKDKTVLRAGYGVSYTGAARFFYGINSPQSEVPGLIQNPNPIFSTYTTLADIRLPITGPGIPGVPLAPVPLNDRTQNLQAFDDNKVIPYIQNWNLELQRELARNLTLEVRYVGSKGTKLEGAIPINTVNIFENGILEAFNVTRAGGNAPLFDQMLGGLNLGLGAVNGTTVTGSASLRQNTIFRSFIANGDAGQFADALNRNTVVTGQGGGLVRNGGYPENFIVVNPQFNSISLHSNPSNSTYHSLNLQVTKRLSHGFTNQTAYTWSRAIGAADGDGVLNYLNPRDRAFNKALLSYHRTHDFRSSGTFELPLGSNRALLSDAPAVVQRLVERWQLGAILTLNSGGPLNLVASTSSIHQFANNMPEITGDFPKSLGKVTRVSNGVMYFDGLRQVDDPARAAVTLSQTTQGSFSNRAIADGQGNVLLVNPSPGRLGTLGQRWIEGPGSVGLDMNLVKRVRIHETKEFEFRMDAINVLNRPNFGTPQLDINNTNFGRITSATGNRSFVVNARVNF